MVTLADSLRSSTGRRLALRKRPDLSATKHRYQGRTYWIVKEPIGLHYFRFQEEEYAILDLLDGDRSLDDVKADFEAQFPPQKIRLEELGMFLGTLHRSGLIVSDAPGQGRQLKKRYDERRKQEWINRFANILSLRFRGINPERLLTWMDTWLGWIYSRWCVALCMLLALSALLLVTVQFKVFQSKLPTFHQFFTVGNAFWLMLVLGVTKIIHEFGHGLTCKHFGGECHEMGVMMLVLTPCLYCNVSDSWMLPNKWQRAAIGAAGMYVEVVIASICTFVWWYSSPGLLNHLCLSTMFVCSVSTVIFNGNPLLRYDGYYILSDLMEIPNLSQKASSILSRTMGHLCLGLEMQDDPFLPRRNRFLFGLYAVAAAAYRWVVVFSILFFLNEFFKPYRLQVVGQMLGAMSLYGLLIQPLWKLGQFFYVPGRVDLVDKKRLFLSLVVVAMIISAVVLIPLPHRIYANLELEAHEADSIYFGVPGQLESVLVKPGMKVEKGAILARLSNIDLNLALAELQTQRETLEAQLKSLQRLAFKDAAAQARVREVEEQLAGVEQQIKEKEKDLAKLEIKASKSGTILLPPETPLKKPSEGDLANWSGTPFEPKNLGCFLSEQDLLCQIGDPGVMQALVVIDQADVAHVNLDQEVDIKLDELPDETFHGKIMKMSKTDVRVSPRHLSGKAGGELATKTDESGIERPLTISYQALVYPIQSEYGELHIGLRGKAKIHVPWEPLGTRLWRWFSQTFHFRL
jgi:putative peptide zinc metalloprotease protein